MTEIDTTPELNENEAAIEAILFASGEPVPAERIALVLSMEEAEVFAAAKRLGDSYSFGRRGLRIVRLENNLQMCSAQEYAQAITRCLEKRKPPKLSKTALEVLAIIAYYQPATRALIDRVRGVDSAYTVGVLLQRGLIQAKGRLDVPGRPVAYATTDLFLRTMGVSSLDELPPLPDLATSEGTQQLLATIQNMKKEAEQLTIEE